MPAVQRVFVLRCEVPVAEHLRVELSGEGGEIVVAGDASDQRVQLEVLIDEIDVVMVGEGIGPFLQILLQLRDLGIGNSFCGAAGGPAIDIAAGFDHLLQIDNDLAQRLLVRHMHRDDVDHAPHHQQGLFCAEQLLEAYQSFVL